MYPKGRRGRIAPANLVKATKDIIMKKTIALIAGASILASAAAFANHHEGKGEYDWQAKLEQKFAMVDANGDGNISKEEFLAYKAAKAEEAWEEHAAAAGEDGLVSLEEAKAMHEAKMAEKKAKKEAEE
jgi:hypothetical protein